MIHGRDEGGKEIRDNLLQLRGPNTTNDLLIWENPILLEKEKEAYRRLWELITAPYVEEINVLMKRNETLQKNLDEATDNLFQLGLELSGYSSNDR